MLDETKESKAQKLAAARKKLKEYQKRGVETAPVVDGSISSNVSEKSDIDCNVSEHGSESKNEISTVTTTNVIVTPPPPPTTTKSTNNIKEEQQQEQNHSNSSTTDAIQILIAEKTKLSHDVNKYQLESREYALKLEELSIQLKSATERLSEYDKQLSLQQRDAEDLRNNNADLLYKITRATAENDDKTAHIQELQKQITLNEQNMEVHMQKIKETSDKLEMAEIRIQQLSDESNLSNDNRIETMMQTQLMYEQQIRDLQAMVQQLTTEKEQANVQYQNYVQLLNMEMSKLNERHIDMQRENESLQQREQQLVNHIAGLEREIQKNINLQQKLTDNSSCAPDDGEMAKLREKISDLEFERHEFVLKIKSQEDRLQLLTSQLEQKDNELENLSERVTNDQPDQTKLLATMESDKIAASRALAQNVELKKQLEEMEQRFVQLTNDKAELRNLLDAEEFSNRDMRLNYEKMEETLQNMTERFKFKDEEMIRLAHENSELLTKLEKLDQQLKENGDCNHNGHAHEDDVDACQHNINNNHHDHEHKHDNHEKIEPCNEAKEQTDVHNSTNEKLMAMQKLEERFTKLMSQVADLTEEKQRLEHLVLQLQGETETIGEYITLYQRQRRMLKQREYEKAEQMQLLQVERERLREKVQLLNNLVSSLGVDVATTVSNINSTIDTVDKKENESNESKLIINKMQHIITEIEENTKDPVHVTNITHSADHLNCCLGKFEVV